MKSKIMIPVATKVPIQGPGVIRKTPRMPVKVAVDPAWSKKCVCPEGANWRFPGSTQRKCPSCGGVL